MRTSLKIIIGMALLSSVLLLVLSNFINSSLKDLPETVSLGSQIFVFIHLYPTNLIASYIGGRSLKANGNKSIYKSLGILWLVQNIILLLIVGVYPLLAILSIGMLLLGIKHTKGLNSV